MSFYRYSFLSFINEEKVAKGWHDVSEIYQILFIKRSKWRVHKTHFQSNKNKTQLYFTINFNQKEIEWKVTKHISTTNNFYLFRFRETISSNDGVWCKKLLHFFCACRRFNTNFEFYGILLRFSLDFTEILQLMHW